MRNITRNIKRVYFRILFFTSAYTIDTTVTFKKKQLMNHETNKTISNETFKITLPFNNTDSHFVGFPIKELVNIASIL